jgi:hypothetical protein
MPEHGFSRKREYFYSNDKKFSLGNMFLHESQGMKRKIGPTLSVQLGSPLPIHTCVQIYRRIGQPAKLTGIAVVVRKSDESAFFPADLNFDSSCGMNKIVGRETSCCLQAMYAEFLSQARVTIHHWLDDDEAV